jgi:hypothetical protein
MTCKNESWKQLFSSHLKLLIHPVVDCITTSLTHELVLSSRFLPKNFHHLVYPSCTKTLCHEIVLAVWRWKLEAFYVEQKKNAWWTVTVTLTDTPLGMSTWYPFPEMLGKPDTWCEYSHPELRAGPPDNINNLIANTAHHEIKYLHETETVFIFSWLFR